MILSEMITLLEEYADDTIDTPSAIRWLNAGLNKLAVSARCTFPQLQLTPDLSDTFVFPEKYHEIPVLYAASRYKGQDSSLSEKRDYAGEFAEGLADFTENYTPPVQWRDEPYIQQYRATEGQTVFVITKDSYNTTYGNLKMYVNSLPVDFYKDGSTITLINPVAAGDYVSALWDETYSYTTEPTFWPRGW